MRLFDVGTRPGHSEVVHDRVATAANAITAVRLAGLPVFAWLVLGPGALWSAFWLLVAVAATDWIDGYVARRFNQVTRLGKPRDPPIDRALLAGAGITLVFTGILPVAVVAVVVVRDALLLGGALVLFGRIPPIPVTRVGKLATAALLIGLPGFLLGAIEWPGRQVLAAGAWAFTLVGIACYWAAGVQYARAAADLRRIREGRRA
ncbi:MAG: CDP-alcohol phosphatidyltransferase family protein [Egibacteraceae bacterium]